MMIRPIIIIIVIIIHYCYISRFGLGIPHHYYIAYQLIIILPFPFQIWLRTLFGWFGLASALGFRESRVDFLYSFFPAFILFWQKQTTLFYSMSMNEMPAPGFPTFIALLVYPTRNVHYIMYRKDFRIFACQSQPENLA